MDKSRILIVDDDQGVIKTLSHCLGKLPLDLETALSINEGMTKICQGDFDVVLLDVNLPDGNGIDHIPHILDREFPPLVIIMTGYTDPEGAELAIESGAWDYLQKPVSPKDLRLQIYRAVAFQKEKRRAAVCPKFEAPRIIGQSAAIRKCLAQAAQIVCSDGNVLLTGETGTGKEIFARAIHENSARRNGDFVVVDCSVLSENLMESVLFGHEKGAFTGADKNRKGLVALANGGTLFLDEVGELPESMQSSFLRVLQEKTFRPVGNEKEVYSNFRLICATNKDLEQLASEGRFRTDLLFRLKTFVLNLPPLRERRDDIGLISRHEIERICQSHQIPVKRVAPDFVEALKAYDWPGNVRELINTIERSVTTALFESILFAFHLPSKIRARIVRSRISEPVGETSGEHAALACTSYKESMDRAEKEYLEAVYAMENGDIQRIMSRTGLSRTVLYRKLKRLTIR